MKTFEIFEIFQQLKLRENGWSICSDPSRNFRVHYFNIASCRFALLRNGAYRIVSVIVSGEFDSICSEKDSSWEENSEVFFKFRYFYDTFSNINVTAPDFYFSIIFFRYKDRSI